MSTVLNLILAVLSFFLSLTTCYHLGWYLSSHDQRFFAKIAVFRGSDYSEPVLWNLLLDFTLVLLFVVQHTCMARLKRNYDLGVLCRTIYVAATSLVLQVLMNFWKPVLSMCLWSLNTDTSPACWWFFSICHVLCWLAIYGGALVMDMLELVGLKQVYYEMQGWPQPFQRKSQELQRLYRHMRHPGFTAFVVLLWVHPVMRLDRLILGIALPLYMVLAFKVDQKDHQYHRYQLSVKKRELKGFL